MFSRDYGLIIACDVVSLQQLEKLVIISATSNAVVGFKLGFQLALRFGLRQAANVVKEHSSLPVIYDHQKGGTDIPQMGKTFAECCVEGGVDAAIIFPQAGPSSMRAFVTCLSESGLIPIVGATMTHPKYLRRDGGFIADEAPLEIVQIAKSMGVKHFVVPGNQSETIREITSGLQEYGPCALLMPGIGAQGGSVHEAFYAGIGHHCYAIVGSAIYGAADPESALREFSELVESYGH